MFQGTTIYFTQGLPCYESVGIIDRLMQIIGAQPRILGDKEGVYSLKKCNQYKYVPSLSCEAILRAETVYFCYDFHIEKVCGNRINSTYNYTYLTQEKIWRLNYDVNLLPAAVYEAKGNDGDGNPSKYNYKLAEVFKFYDLVKYLHLELKSELTAGSCLDDYMQFGEDEGTHWGYDSILRFDKNGQCRLIAPYEERRDIVKTDLDSSEIDGNIVANWCLDIKQPRKIEVSAEFLKLIMKSQTKL